MRLNNGDLVEASSDEEGFRGAWFCGKLVKKQGAKFIVEYKDLLSDEDETKPLREIVDNRHIRPSPPEQSKDQFNLYEEVDAYVNEGWWVGVVTKVLDNHEYIIYFLQTKEEIKFHHDKLRPHLEFIDNKWVEVYKALIGTSSPSEVINLDDSVFPYVSHQNAETGKQITMVLSSPMASVDKKPENRSSKSVRRSSRHLEKQNETTHKDSDSAVRIRKSRVDGLPIVGSLSTSGLTNGKQGDGHQCDGVSPRKVKQVGEQIPEGCPQRTWKEKLRQASAPIVIPDRGVCKLLLTDHEASSMGTKTGRQLDPRRTPRKIGSQLDNVSVKNRKRKKEHGTGATNLGASDALIGVEGKHKKRLISSSSLHSCDGINTTTSEAHNEVVNPCITLNMKSDINIHRDISESSLKTKKKRTQNMPNEINTQEGYELVGAVPAGEKIFTVTIPYLEYVGQSSADKGSGGCLHGKASLKALNLIAYNSVLQALYHQGAHNWKSEVLLTDLRESLNISNEEHSIELRRITRGDFD